MCEGWGAWQLVEGVYKIPSGFSPVGTIMPEEVCCSSSDRSKDEDGGHTSSVESWGKETERRDIQDINRLVILMSKPRR